MAVTAPFEPDFVNAIRSEYSSCFACGTDNPVGLHLSPAEMRGKQAVAVFRPTELHGGAGETLHGGLAATVLDEIMVWAGILIHRVLTVTATMELRYRRPLTVNDEIEAVGRVAERSGRRLRMEGELRLAGRPAVTSQGLYVVVRSFEASET